ncbi:CHAT domain protein [Ceratobasidium sp. AG-Ba]|nr:CHAT domain protein [Ceratobasidium sp. AG-Ba]
MTPALPPSQESQIHMLTSIALSFMEAYKSQCDPELLDIGIACGRHALVLSKQAQLPTQEILVILGVFLSKRCERFGDLSDIEEAIACDSRAAALSQNDILLQGACLSHLGVSLQRRFDRLGDLVDLEDAIRFQAEGIQLTPCGHPDRPGYLNNLAMSLKCRFEHLGQLEDIANAIGWQLQAVNSLPQDDPDKPSYLTNLGNAWSRRFGCLNELDDMYRAIECRQQAVQLAPEGHPYRPGYLSNLGNSLRCRFEQLGQLEDLDHAVVCQSQAVQLTPEDHPKMPIYLENLGGSWHARFERLGQLEDLDHAIDCQTHAVRLTPDGQPDKPRFLAGLGDLWGTRSEHTGVLEDTHRAIDLQICAIRLTSEGHPSRPGYLDSLGTLLARRFGHGGGPEDLENAIKCQVQALKLTPDEHPAKPSYLNSLGKSFDRRFEYLGELASIDRAIDLKARAVQLTLGGQPFRHNYLNSLGISWTIRFERLGELEDINHAIECQAKAIQLTPMDHPAMPSYLNSLGNSFSYRFERLRNITDIDRAIDYQTRAVQLCPESHTKRPAFFNNLGVTWWRRFVYSGALSDLEHAIDSQMEALHTTHEADPYRCRLLNNLAVSWQWRFKYLGEIQDIHNAIHCQEEAIRLASERNACGPGNLHNLGIFYLKRLSCLGKLQDLELAWSTFQKGTRSDVIDPASQMRCAQKWAEASMALERSPLQAYEAAFLLLPSLVWIGQTVQHRQSILNIVGDLASEAAAWAISIKSYDLALEWLEQGRSIIWSQKLQLRTPFEELSLVDPVLAAQLRDVACELDAAGSRSSLDFRAAEAPVNLVTQSQRHHELAFHWQELLAKARQYPDFCEYLLPRKAKDLKKAARDGPIVIINVHHTRCDALVILPGVEDVVHVPLVELTEHKLIRIRGQCSSLAQRHDIRGFKRQGPRDTLQPFITLWSDIVRPILNVLPSVPDKSSSLLPHITWCATGTVSFLPLHAAGMYDGQSPNTFDLVVSSYTPTIGVLLSAVTNTIDTDPSLLVIGQDKSPGLPPLPNTAKELDAIKKYTGQMRYDCLTGASATVLATLDAMEEHSWVHFACHATQNRTNPNQSAFMLHDGVLTLEEISKRAFKRKGLAFLSACQTATGDDGLPDEATHLAAGLLVAGYPSVIATMWSIMDEDAPEVADVVYAKLLNDGIMDHTKAARALHEAARRLREKIGVKAIERWAPFVHIGA